MFSDVDEIIFEALLPAMYGNVRINFYPKNLRTLNIQTTMAVLDIKRLILLHATFSMNPATKKWIKKVNCIDAHIKQCHQTSVLRFIDWMVIGYHSVFNLGTLHK